MAESIFAVELPFLSSRSHLSSISQFQLVVLSDIVFEGLIEEVFEALCSDVSGEGLLFSLDSDSFTFGDKLLFVYKLSCTVLCEPLRELVIKGKIDAPFTISYWGTLLVLTLGWHRRAPETPTYTAFDWLEKLHWAGTIIP